jgi:hypothetical protein
LIVLLREKETNRTGKRQQNYIFFCFASDCPVNRRLHYSSFPNSDALKRLSAIRVLDLQTRSRVLGDLQNNSDTGEHRAVFRSPVTRYPAAATRFLLLRPVESFTAAISLRTRSDGADLPRQA